MDLPHQAFRDLHFQFVGWYDEFCINEREGVWRVDPRFVDRRHGRPSHVVAAFM